MVERRLRSNSGKAEDGGFGRRHELEGWAGVWIMLAQWLRIPPSCLRSPQSYTATKTSGHSKRVIE
jgi:hypothetical protein